MTYQKSEYHKLPRLFIEHPFEKGETLTLEKEQVHYLCNVVRRKTGDLLRVFNGMDGEYLAELSGLTKKAGEVTLMEFIRPQPQKRKTLALVFAPIKKNRQDMMIEKAVELGVDAFYPVIMDHSQIHKINLDRIEKQILEASEQSERLTIPLLHDIAPLQTCLEGLAKDHKVIMCAERHGARLIADIARGLTDEDIALVIGPEGGLSDDEFALAQTYTPASLGETILRSETAALAAISLFRLGV